MDIAWTHGWSGLMFAYAAVQAPMLAGLIRGRAAPHKYLASPLVALPLTGVAGIAMSVAGPLLLGLGADPHGLLQLSLGTALSGALGYSGGRSVAAEQADPRIHQRGAVVMERPGETRPAPGSNSCARITLAGAQIPLADEAKHFKLIGTTGTGKSTAVQEILETALERGDRAVIADPDGGYLRRFYSADRGDVVLNPFDRRSAKWDFFGEIRNAYDVDHLARSLIPDQGGSDRSWREYARTFFSAVTWQAHQSGVEDLGELYRLLMVADSGELRTLLRGTPAQPFLEEHNSRMFDSIRSVTSSAVGALGHIARQEGALLSVRRWVNETSSGVLFIPYKAGQIAALRSTISGWMRLAIFEAMDRDEAMDQETRDRDAAGATGATPTGGAQSTAGATAPNDAPRLWFVVDELDALGQIDGLKDALARLRKFGGRCVLGFQSIAQVSSTYGQGDAHTIVENCGNTLILRCSASEGGGTARFASQLIGEREVLRPGTSHSRRFSELFGSVSRSQHLAVESAVLPSQIEQLPDLAGYMKCASDPRWHRVRLEAVRRWRERRTAGGPAPPDLRDRDRAHDPGRAPGPDGRTHD